jgi:hypothetical protein
MSVAVVRVVASHEWWCRCRPVGQLTGFGDVGDRLSFVQYLLGCVTSSWRILAGPGGAGVRGAPLKARC